MTAQIYSRDVTGRRTIAGLFPDRASAEQAIDELKDCPHCQGTDLVRHGKTPQGKQRYRCREASCPGGTFLFDYSYSGQSGRTGCRSPLPATAVCR